MSWLDAAWARRAAVTVPNVGGDPVVNVTITIPPEWDAFWLRVDSGGADIRLTRADGRTEVVFKRASWTYATRTCVLQIQELAVADAVCLAWLYWDNPDAEDAALDPSIAGPIDGFIYLPLPVAPIVRVGQGRRGGLAAQQTVIKGAAEEVRVCWDFAHILASTPTPIAGHRVLEEIRRVDLVDVLDLTEDSVPSMVDADLTRICISGGQVSTWLKAGTSGDDYIAICRVTTTEDCILEGRVKVRVADVEI